MVGDMYVWGRALKKQLLSAVVFHPFTRDDSFRLNWADLHKTRAGGKKTRRSRRARPAADLFRIELLEPRLLLSADLAPGAEQALLKGLTDFASVLDPANAVHDAALSAVLPMINRNVAEMVDLGGLVNTIGTATASYFGSTATATTAGLAATLDALTQTTGAVTETLVNGIEKFSMTVAENFDPAPYILDLSNAVHGLDLTVQGAQTLTATGQHSLTFAFGIDTATNQFVVFPGSFAATVNATGTNLNFGLIFGVADTQVTGAAASLTANVTGNIVDPDNLDGLGIITPNELAATPVDFLIDGHVAGNASLSLPTSGGLLPHAETAAITWTGDLGPTSANVTYGANSTLSQLSGLTHSDLTGVLQQAFAALPDVLADVGVKGPISDIPILGSQFSGLIDLSDTFRSLTQPLPDFHSLGDLKTILESWLGGTADFGLSGSKLTLALGVQSAFTTTIDADVATQISGQDFAFSGQVAVQGTASAKIAMTIDLNPGIADGDRLVIVEGPGSFVQLDLGISTSTPLAGVGHLGGALVDVSGAAFTMSGALGDLLLPNALASIHVDLRDRTETFSDGIIKLREFAADPARAIGVATATGVGRFEATLRAPYAPNAQPVPVSIDWVLAGNTFTPKVTVDAAAFQLLVPNGPQLVTSSQVDAAALDPANRLGDLATAVTGRLAADFRPEHVARIHRSECVRPYADAHHARRHCQRAQGCHRCRWNLDGRVCRPAGAATGDEFGGSDHHGRFGWDMGGPVFRGHPGCRQCPGLQRNR